MGVRRCADYIGAILLVVLLCCPKDGEAGTLGVGSAVAGAPVADTPADTDDDGLFDYVYVLDWDGDGFQEMKDIQDALDALTDPSGITVEVGPGDFCPPDPSGNHPTCPDEPIYGTYGLIELPSRATLRCSGVGSTLLNGTNPAEFSLPGTQRSIIANRDRFSGNEGINIESCDVDAGLGSSYDSSLFASTPSVRAIDLWNTRDVTISNSSARWSAHSAIYAKNAVNLLMTGNTTTDCGGVLDTGTVFRQPCVYIFADGGASKPTDGVTISNHYAARARSALYNTRRATHLDVFRNVVFQDSMGVDSNAECIALRGGSEIQILNVMCHDTAGFKTLGPSGGVTAYASDGVPGSTGALSGLVVSGLTITSSRDTTEGTPFSLRSRLEDAQIEDVLIDGTFADDACFRPEGPWRNTVLRDLVLRNCGAEGVNQHATPGTEFGSTLEERLWVDGLTIDGTDAGNLRDSIFRDGILLQRDNGWVRVENFSISGFTRAGIGLPGTRSLGRLELQNGVFEGTPNGFGGSLLAAELPLCDAASEGAWHVITDAASGVDCLGGASQRNDCECDGAVWVDKGNFFAPAAGILLSGEVYSLSIMNVTFENIRGAYGLLARAYLNDAFFGDIDARQTNGETETSRQTLGAIKIEGDGGDTVFGDVSCDASSRGEWWRVTDALSSSDCSNGGGNSEAMCICDGSSLQPRQVTASNVTCVGTDASSDCVVGADSPVQVPGLSPWGARLVGVLIIAIAGLRLRAVQARTLSGDSLTLR
jgi:hypothetical protein